MYFVGGGGGWGGGVATVPNVVIRLPLGSQRHAQLKVVGQVVRVSATSRRCC